MADAVAFERLFPIVYGELQRLAAAYIRRERVNHTLQPTALIHEASLRLVDSARSHRAAKRGGGINISLDDVVVSASER